MNNTHDWYDWGKLDIELTNGYKKDKQFVYKFCSKYKISVPTIYKRLRKLNIKIRDNAESHDNGEGEKHHSWKGGRHTENGYVFIYIGKGKYKQEHRLVVEKQLERKLTKNEIVHHVDECFEARSNNNDSNLKLMIKKDHDRHHRIGRGKGYSIYFHKGHNKWVLEVRNKINYKWGSVGNYKTKEEALWVAEHKYGLKVEYEVVCSMELTRVDVEALKFAIKRCFEDYELEGHEHGVSLKGLLEVLEGV